MTAILGDFNAYSPLWHSKLPGETKGNNIASEIHISNHAVLNETARTKAKNSCKNYPDISLASSSIAMNLDWRPVYKLGLKRKLPSTAKPPANKAI